MRRKLQRHQVAQVQLLRDVTSTREDTRRFTVSQLSLRWRRHQEAVVTGAEQDVMPLLFSSFVNEDGDLWPQVGVRFQEVMHHRAELRYRYWLSQSGLDEIHRDEISQQRLYLLCSSLLPSPLV